MGERWVKLYEKIETSSFYHDSELVHLWIHLLLKASKFGNVFLWNGEEIKLKPGQLITGRKKLSEQLGICESKIQRALNLFERCHMIEQQTTNKNRIITIVKWYEYQSSEQQTNNQRTTTEQQLNTIKKDRKIESKNKENTYSNEFEEVWKITPSRNGTKQGKKPASKLFEKLSIEEKRKVYKGVKNYAEYINQPTTTQNAMDLERFIRNRFFDDYQDGVKQINNLNLGEYLNGKN